jgi:SAM-dependent methyltransferase
VRALRKDGPGRPRKYKNAAAKQRAYRTRLKRAADPYQAAKDQRYALMRLGEHAALMPDSATLWHGDFREMGISIPDASVALALCDPPYGKAWLSHVDGFGALCARVLKPGASLLMLYGQMYLPDVLHTLATHLRYHWLCSYQLKSAAAAIWPRRIMNHWKPLIWCTQGEYTGEYQGDVLMGEGKDKRFHLWGQSAALFAALVQRFTMPGDVVLDPVCGGGTTGAVALTLRRRFIGIDCDPEAIAITRARLSAIAEDQRRGALHLPQPSFIETAYQGNNAKLIAHVAKLYIPDGALVADVTYGKGVWWRKTPTSRFTLLASDLLTCPDRPYDFRSLPYAPGSLDVYICDPPYIHHPGRHVYDQQYQNSATTGGMSHDDVLQLYQAGMQEARRVLKPAGSQLWVKCKDEVSSGRQCFSHGEIYEHAKALGFQAQDLFVLVAKSHLLGRRWDRQFHARKTHSYLWVFTLGRFRPPRHADARPFCGYCGAPFTPQRSTGQYCDATCRKAAWRVRNATPTGNHTGALSVAEGELF